MKLTYFKYTNTDEQDTPNGFHPPVKNNFVRMKNLLYLLIMLTIPLGAQPFKTQNVIVITLDGFRWQEVFTGADSSFFNNKALVKNSKEVRTKFWNDNTEERRKLLLPFFWETIAKNGQIYGNRLKGSFVNVKNPYWFSYPGYNEIFTGYPDVKVNSNEYGPNPNKNVLEFIHQSKGFNDKVAVFSSWNALPDILNRKRSGLFINSAFDKTTVPGLSQQYEHLMEYQDKLPDFLGGVRLDAMTFQLGFQYLKEKRPRVLYLSFDETDDLAHEGRYDLYLNSAHYTDGFIRELWNWVQSDKAYKDKTTILITVDHGRGIGEPGWRSHGEKTEHSSETWFAVIGPDVKPLGEIKNGQFYNAQFSYTIATLLGLKYVNEMASGQPIHEIFEGLKTTGLNQ